MNFLFWLANHSKVGQRSLEDVIGIIGHQMRALGHTAVWDPRNQNLLTRSRGYNVLVEGFTPGIATVLAEQHARGARFLCVATEEPTERGFNHGTQPEMIKRQRDFALVAPYLDAILHLVPGEAVTAWYSRHAPSAPIELGYAPTLVRAETQAEPPFDFGFYGSLSRRRLRILRELARRSGRSNAVRIVADFRGQVERDRLMQEAKVIVQLRKFDEMGLVSSSRCNTALCLGRPVVAEPHALSHPWDEVVRFSADDRSFFDEALAARAMWRGLHAAQFARFRELFTPRRCVGEPLERVGVLERRAAA